MKPEDPIMYVVIVAVVMLVAVFTYPYWPEAMKCNSLYTSKKLQSIEKRLTDLERKA